MAKLSDPDHKAKRSDQGATAKRAVTVRAGREVYVSNVDWSADEQDVQEVFAKYGEVERVRIPKNPHGKSKGMAFVVFKQKVSRHFIPGSMLSLSRLLGHGLRTEFLLLTMP